MNLPALQRPVPFHLGISTGGLPVLELNLDGTEDEYRIGRGAQAANLGHRITLEDEYVSRHHCRIYWDDGAGWMVEDLQSANGTQVNGRPMLGPVEVLDGLTLNIGTSVLEIEPTPDLTQFDADRSESQATKEQAEQRWQAADETLIQDDTLIADRLVDGPGPDNLAIDHMGATRDASSLDDETDLDASLPFLLGQALQDDTQLTGVATDLEPVPAQNHRALEATEEEASNASMEEDKEGLDVRHISPGIGRDLIAAGLLHLEELEALMNTARLKGQTLIGALARTRNVRFLDGVYDWIALREKLDYFESEEALYDEVDRPDWLDLDVAERYGIVALHSGHDEIFRYATVDPYDLRVTDWLERQRGGLKEKVLAHPSVLFAVLERLRSQTETGAEDLGVSIDFSPEQAQEVIEHVEQIDVPRMVNYFLHRAAVQDASDIHVEPGDRKLTIRQRVDGILYEDLSLPMAYHREICSRLKIMAGMNVAERRRPQDGRISVSIRGKPIDVRVSTYPTVHGEKVVLRLLDKSALRPSPEHLGLLNRDLRLVKEKLQAPYGLIMVSGPTGSGKTTTLYSCLGSIDKSRKNILTVEDPVEYQIPGVHQMQVNAKIGLTFASGLRTMLRQDPDVIMVGESRDVETAQMAIQAALTGHVVFSTIHTNDAIGVVTRLMDMKIEPFLVASALSLTVAQRLVRKVCPHCKTSVTGEEIMEDLAKDGISEERLEKLGIDIDEEMDYAQGRGCAHCRGTGYMGRRAVFEVFEINRDVRSLITSPDFTETRLHEVARGSGMTTLISHGLKLVDDEVTTFSEVIRVLGESQ